MNISILTPCFNAGQWLPQCISSVVDQTASKEPGPEVIGQKSRESVGLSVLGAEDKKPEIGGHLLKAKSSSEFPIHVHHHVQDACSPDGTREVLSQRLAKSQEPKGNGYTFSYASEKDGGMYNALNRAFASTDGEIVGHLNADEQYLPGTLAFVADYFEKQPKVDVLFGAVVVTDADGNYICSRMPLTPQLLHTQVCHLCSFTASMFFRRSAIEKLGMYFDESFKAAGDADLICRMLKAKLKMVTVRRYFSIFSDSGDNLALSSTAKEERVRMSSLAPRWARELKVLVIISHYIRKLFYGTYTMRKFTYKFIMADGAGDKFVEVLRPKGRWASRMGA